MKTLVVIVLTVLAIAAGARAQQAASTLDKALASAEHKAVVEGDLKGALAAYEGIVARAAQNRAIAARAWLAIANIYRTLGDGRERDALTRIATEYGDQPAAAEVRGRLANARPRTENTPVNRSVWTPPSTVDIHGKLSPDGRWLPYRDLESAEGGLFIRDVIAGTNRRLVELPRVADEGGGEYPEGSAFSRDGRLLAFAWRVRARGIYQLRVVGAEPKASPAVRVLVDNEDIEWLAPYDWTPDGQWIATVIARKDRTVAIGLVSSRDGRWRQLKSVEWNGVLNVALSPDGRHLAFDRRTGEAGRRDVFVLGLDGSREHVVASSTGDDSLVGWSPDGGRILFVSDRTGTSGLWSVAASRGTPTGQPTLLYPNVGPFWPLGVSSSGAIWSVVLAPAGAQVRSARLVDLQPANVQVLDDFAGPTTTLRWSPRGERLAWASQWLGLRPLIPILEEQQGLRLIVRETDGGNTRRLETELAYINDFDWATDGRSLVAAGGDRTGRTGLFRIDVDTGRTLALMLTPGEQVDLPRFSAPLTEGRTPTGSVTENHVYYRRIRIKGQTSKLVELDLRTGVERDILPWSKRFWRGRPDPGTVAVDVLAITRARQVLYLTSSAAGDSVSLNAISLDDGHRRELLRSSAADRLDLLGVTADARAAIVRKDIGASKRSEAWLVPIDGAREPVRLNTREDLSGFRSVGWSVDGSELLLERRTADDRSELATLSPSGQFRKMTVDHEVFWTTVSPDGQRMAYGTAFREPAAPLAVWVLEHAIDVASK